MKGCWDPHPRLSLIGWVSGSIALLLTPTCPGSLAKRETPGHASTSQHPACFLVHDCFPLAVLLWFQLHQGSVWAADRAGSLLARSGEGCTYRRREKQTHPEEGRKETAQRLTPRSSEMRGGKKRSPTWPRQANEQHPRPNRCWMLGNLIPLSLVPNWTKLVWSWREVVSEALNHLVNRADVEKALLLSPGWLHPPPVGLPVTHPMELPSPMELPHPMEVPPPMEVPSPTARWKNTQEHVDHCAVLDNSGCPLVDEGW